MIFCHTFYKIYSQLSIHLSVSFCVYTITGPIAIAAKMRLTKIERYCFEFLYREREQIRKIKIDVMDWTSILKDRLGLFYKKDILDTKEAFV